jgi:predicted metal-binding membrane protein
MLLLFVGGVMNVLWIAALAALVLLEKALPFGKFVSRIFGCVFIAGGAWFLLQM